MSDAQQAAIGHKKPGIGFQRCDNLQPVNPSIKDACSKINGNKNVSTIIA